jgi:excisionase family DNA binding protein
MSEATNSVGPAQPLRFYSVSETADILGVSEMTLYRQIRANTFPAIRVGSRLVVPARCLEEMVDTAFKQNSVVNPADWVPAASPEPVL